MRLGENRSYESMVQDNIDDIDPISFLGLADKEILKRLALLDGVSEEEEISLLIRSRARAFSRLKALLPDARPSQPPQEIFHARKIHIREDEESPAGDDPTPHRPPSP